MAGRKARLGLLAGGVLVAACAALALGGASTEAAGPAAAPEPPPSRMPAPDHVPRPVQSELRSRMGRHGATMQTLVRAVVLLDRARVRTLATRIADEEIVARVTPPADRRPPMRLPEGFFTQQDELRAAAQKLAVATDGAEDAVLADRFANVVRTCIGCHSEYLHGRVDEAKAP